MTENIVPAPFAMSEAELTEFVDRIPAYVMFVDRERRHRYANFEYFRSTGRRPDEIIGRTVAEVLGDEAFERLRPMSDRALSGEDVAFSGWMAAERDGPLRFGQVFYLPHHDAGGAIDGYFVLVRDLTELKLADARGAAIVASALEGVVVVDERGVIVEFNPAAEAMFDYPRDLAVGRPMAELIIPPALRGAHHEGMERYLRTGVARMIGRRIEIEAMRNGGALFPVELAITEVRIGDVRLFAAHIRDLTAAREAAAEIQRQRDALHQSEKMAAFGSLLAGVAHELNNPLSIVVGHALMLEEEAAGGPHAERAAKIRVAAERCGHIVRSFLAMARRRETRLAARDVGALVDGALQLLGHGLKSRGVDVERDIPADLPPARCDADQLHQVLANLITNAQHALEARAPPRIVRIAARRAAECVEIRVSDNGPGVPAEFRERIFDPFFTTKPIGSGTGVGLSISRGIVEAHGGSLRLEPADGEGAIFVMSLPIAEARAAEGSIAPRATSASGNRGLIVDDEPEVAELLRDMARAQGFDCDIAENGERAIELLAGRDYDAILCDLRMPVMDGRAFLDWLRLNRPGLVERLAFITGDALGYTRDQVVAASGRPILEKPFMSAELSEVLAQLASKP